MAIPLFIRKAMNKVPRSLRVALHKAYLTSPYVNGRYISACGVRYFDTKDKKVYRFVPTFTIIGGMKCGTTSLYHALNNHPDIYMSQVKEPGFLLDPKEKTSEGKSNDHIRQYLSDAQLLKWMLKKYKGQPCIGEASTYYTKSPHKGLTVAKRAQKWNKDMMFVYIVRNPFDRFVSQFLHESREGDPRALIEVFEKGVGKDHPLCAYGRYYFQLQQYLDLYPQKNVKVVLYEDFARSPQKVLDEIYHFLGLKPTEHVVKLKKYNVSKNRSKYSKKDLKFSKTAYSKLKKIFETDVKKLESFMGKKTKWDLSQKTWCK